MDDETNAHEVIRENAQTREVRSLHDAVLAARPRWWPRVSAPSPLARVMAMDAAAVREMQARHDAVLADLDALMPAPPPEVVAALEGIPRRARHDILKELGFPRASLRIAPYGKD